MNIHLRWICALTILSTAADATQAQVTGLATNPQGAGTNSGPRPGSAPDQAPRPIERARALAQLDGPIGELTSEALCSAAYAELGGGKPEFPGLSPDKVVALLGPRDLGALSDEMGRPMRGLLGLSRLRLALGDKGSSPLGLEQIEQGLADLDAATGDAELAEGLRQGLEVKYTREKDTRRVRALRDMKKSRSRPDAGLVAGRRSPDETPSATKLGDPGSETAPSHGPPVPPGPANGIRPEVKGSATPLPPLDTTAPVRGGTAAPRQDEQRPPPAKTTSTSAPITRGRDARTPANRSRNLDEEARRLLIRVVRAWEQERVRTPLVRVIPGPDQPQAGNPLCDEGEDDKEFIKEVGHSLGAPPLSNAERCLAVALRKRNVEIIRTVHALRTIRAQPASR
jgi:hypothetical protein